MMVNFLLPHSPLTFGVETRYRVVPSETFFNGLGFYVGMGLRF
jgi:hypothetical protein